MPPVTEEEEQSKAEAGEGEPATSGPVLVGLDVLVVGHRWLGKAHLVCGWAVVHRWDPHSWLGCGPSLGSSLVAGHQIHQTASLSAGIPAQADDVTSCPDAACWTRLWMAW